MFDLYSVSFGLYNNFLFSIVNELVLDVVFLIGDMIDGDELLYVVMVVVCKLVKEFLVFYVSGNYEGWSVFYEDFKVDMEKYYVIVFENECYFLKKDGVVIMVVGVWDFCFVRDDWVEKELLKEVWEEVVLKEVLDDVIVNLLLDYFMILLVYCLEFWLLY